MSNLQERSAEEIANGDPEMKAIIHKRIKEIENQFEANHKIFRKKRKLQPVVPESADNDDTQNTINANSMDQASLITPDQSLYVASQ